MKIHLVADVRWFGDIEFSEKELAEKLECPVEEIPRKIESYIKNCNAEGGGDREMNRIRYFLTLRLGEILDSTKESMEVGDWISPSYPD